MGSETGCDLWCANFHTRSERVSRVCTSLRDRLDCGVERIKRFEYVMVNGSQLGFLHASGILGMNCLDAEHIIAIRAPLLGVAGRIFVPFIQRTRTLRPVVNF